MSSIIRILNSNPKITLRILTKTLWMMEISKRILKWILGRFLTISTFACFFNRPPSNQWNCSTLSAWKLAKRSKKCRKDSDFNRSFSTRKGFQRNLSSPYTTFAQETNSFQTYSERMVAKISTFFLKANFRRF